MVDQGDDEEVRRRNVLLGEDFRAARLARRWRSQTIACRRSGLKRGVISKIEQGDPARLCHYQAYAAALGMRVGLVPDAGDAKKVPPATDALVAAVTARVMSVIMAFDPYREDAVDRRQLIVSLAALLLDSAVPQSLRQLFVEQKLPFSNPDDVEALTADCGQYLLAGRAAAGGGSVCDVAVGMHQQATAWLEQGGHSHELSRALQYLRCELGAWVGWLTLDAGRLDMADHYLERTLAQSRLCGCHAAEARVLDNLVDLLTLRGQLEQSKQAALLGLQVASDMGVPRVMALFHLRAAKVAADLGDSLTFASQATAARKALETSEGSLAPLWLDFLTTGAYFIGEGHLALGQAAEAASEFRSISTAPESNQHCDVVHALIREAQALAMMGDSAAASESAIMALEQAQMLSSDFILRDLRTLHATLSHQPASSTKARHFLATYDSWVAARA